VRFVPDRRSFSASTTLSYASLAPKRSSREDSWLWRRYEECAPVLKQGGHSALASRPQIEGPLRFAWVRPRYWLSALSALHSLQAVQSESDYCVC